MSSREAHPLKDTVPAVSGFVLAGGRSSRMGTDKAMLPLAGRPLIAHALAKLSAVTRTTAILAGTPPGNPELAAFGPLVFDLHPGCGPIAGIEAALTASDHSWSLILPVDVPFLAPGLLAWWVERTLVADSPGRVALLRAGGRIQPTVLLLHRDALPFITQAIWQGEYKMLRALDLAARGLSGDARDDSARFPSTLRITELPPLAAAASDPAHSELLARLSPAECAAECLWFANLNTPEDLAQAEQLLASLPNLL